MLSQQATSAASCMVILEHNRRNGPHFPPFSLLAYLSYCRGRGFESRQVYQTIITNDLVWVLSRSAELSLQLLTISRFLATNHLSYLCYAGQLPLLHRDICLSPWRLKPCMMILTRASKHGLYQAQASYSWSSRCNQTPHTRWPGCSCWRLVPTDLV